METTRRLPWPGVVSSHRLGRECLHGIKALASRFLGEAEHGVLAAARDDFDPVELCAEKNPVEKPPSSAANRS